MRPLTIIWRASCNKVAELKRVRLSILSVPLLIVALGLYFSYASVIFAPKVIGAHRKQIPPHTPATTASGRPVIDNDNPHGSSQENDDGLFTLHPESHIFRETKTINLTWNVTMEERAPDGVIKKVYLINGKFPGPTIEARSGDELIVNVHNSVSDSGNDGIAIHWHGLLMKGTNDMDGVVGLTQCAIGPSQNFTYQFRLETDQSGTFWYHAHSGVQRADGLYGGLIIHRPVNDGGLENDMLSYQYEAEKLLLIGDWYHPQAETLLDRFKDSDSYGMEPAPDSFLVNGRGAYNCSLASNARPVDCKYSDLPVILFPDSERVRLRVVNTGIASGFTMALPKGGLKLITVDGGHAVKNDIPITESIGVLYPGERIDVITERSLHKRGTGDAKAGSPSYDFHITITLDNENMKLRNYGLTPTRSFPIHWQSHENAKAVKMRQSPITPNLALSDVQGAQTESIVGLETPAEIAVLYSTMQIRSTSGNSPVGTVNHTSWVIVDPKRKPLISLEQKYWSEATKQPSRIQKLRVPHFRQFGKDIWVELVVNNLDDTGHPFHLHGYNFYVVATRASQFQAYNPFDSSAVSKLGAVNTINALRKDTIYIPGRGYVVLRFALDNEGLWLFHCHVLWHQAVGMGIVIQVGDVRPEAHSQASMLCSK